MKQDEQTERRFAMMGRAAMLPGMIYLRDLLLPILETNVAMVQQTLAAYQDEQMAAGEMVNFIAGNRKRGRPTEQERELKALAAGQTFVPAKNSNVADVPKKSRKSGWPKDPAERGVEMMRRFNVSAKKRGEKLPHPHVGTELNSAKFRSAVAAYKPTRTKGTANPRHPGHPDHPRHRVWLAGISAANRKRWETYRAAKAVAAV